MTLAVTALLPTVADLTITGAMHVPFTKQHGLGNDFVVFDARVSPLGLTPAAVRRVADRRVGVGCDQLIVIGPSDDHPAADATMTIFNADGSEVGACGNATRCVARLIAEDLGRDHVVIATRAGRLECRLCPDGTVTVDMGPARLRWDMIPLTDNVDTLSIPLGIGDLPPAVAVNVGNPHAVFAVDDAEAVDLAGLGPLIEHYPLFPERTNVEFISRLSNDRLRMRVWERGVGITRACGTGACAAAIAAARLGLTGRECTVTLDGGDLLIAWREDGHVEMTGPVAVSFSGLLPEQMIRP